MSDQKHVTPPGATNIDDALVKEIGRDPKAFFARRIEAIDAEADRLQAKTEEYAEKALAKRAEAEAAKWALAKWCHDQWNPHNEPEGVRPRGARPPTDGIKLSRLAEMVGWSDPSTVSRYINCYTQRVTTSGIRWADASRASLGKTRAVGRDQTAQWRLQRLTDEEKAAKADNHVRLAKQAVEAIEDPEVREKALEAATPEPEQIAKALEKPEVARAVKTKMTEKAQYAMRPEPAWVAKAEASIAQPEPAKEVIEEPASEPVADVNQRMVRQIAKTEGVSEQQVEAEIQAGKVGSRQLKHRARQDSVYWRTSGRIADAKLALRPVRPPLTGVLRDVGELDYEDEDVELLVPELEELSGSLGDLRDLVETIIDRLRGEASSDWDVALAAIVSRLDRQEGDDARS